MKKGLIHFSPFQVSMLRIVFASVALFPYIPKAIKNIEKRDLAYALVIAIIGSGIPSYLFPLAISNIDSAVAGIINALAPVFTMIFGVFLFKTKSNFGKILGLSIALVGAGLLVFLNNDGVQSLSFNSYALAAVFATVCYGLSANVLKAKLNHVNAAQLTSITFFMIGPFALIALLSTDFIDIVKNDSSSYTSIFYVFLLGVLGTGFALVVFNFLIKRTDALYASSVTFLIPIVAVFWGLLDGEIIGVYHLFGLITILVGVYLMNNQQTKQ